MKRNRLIFFAATPIALIAAGAMTVGWVDSHGETFFTRGKAIEDALGLMGRQMRAKDFSGFEKHLGASYQGSRLGWNDLKAVDEKDGIRHLRFQTDKAAVDRTAALAEWKQYLDSFDSIEEVMMHIHRFENWSDPNAMVASIRYELLGSPKGHKYCQDRGYLRVTFKATGAGVEWTKAELMEADRYVNDSPHFTDVAAAAGVDFKNQYYPEFLKRKLKFAMLRYGPAGITAADVDNDGWYDLFIPDGVESKLFRNLGDGKFEDITAKAGLSGLDGVSVGVFADYDNDGFKDFFVSRTFKPNQLFHNNGNGTFTDVTAKSGIGADNFTTVASWADYDNDGDLDLYVGRYLDPHPYVPTTFYARNGEPNQLYRNNGNGSFTNVTNESGVGEVGLCLGSVWGDYDDDGYLDLYVVNDFGRNTLYHNERNGKFTDVTVKTNTLAYGAGMNASMADVNNDGRIDIYVTNIRSDYAWYAEGPTVMRYMTKSWTQNVWYEDMPLYWQIFTQSGTDFVKVFQDMAMGNNYLRNNGKGGFDDVTWETGTNPPGWFWSASIQDYDNDGLPDIYAVNGWVYNDRDSEIELEFLNNVVTQQKTYKTGLFFDPNYFGRRSWHGWERNRYMRQKPDGKFEEIGRAAGSDLILNSRGSAAADYWNRGVMDIAVSASTDKHALLRNELAGKRNWLQVELVGTQSNRDAVGARIVAKADGKMLTREIVLGDGYASQNSLRQHLGIGAASKVDELIVKWPRSGATQKFTNLAANRIIEITEGKDAFVEKKYEKPVAR